MQPLGQPVTLTARTFSDAAKTIPASATEGKIYLLDPTTGTPLAPTTVAPTAEGVYNYTLPGDVSGLWGYRWEFTGAVTTSPLTGYLSVNEAWPPALIGLDDARAELNFTSTTDDDELQGYIYTASALLLNHPAYRVGDVCQVNSYTEWHDSGDVVILRHYPVDVDSVTVSEYSGTTAQPLAYEPLDGDSFTGYGWLADDGTGANGILRRGTSGQRFCGRVKVTYTAGAAVVPHDVRLACLELVRHLWDTQRGNSAGRPVPGFDNEVPTGPEPSFFLLPNRVTEALVAYRAVPSVA